MHKQTLINREQPLHLLVDLTGFCVIPICLHLPYMTVEFLFIFATRLSSPSSLLLAFLGLPCFLLNGGG